jgi:hypothetical protein
VVTSVEISVTWALQFYSSRQGTLARYEVQAPTAAAAHARGREALLAEHRPLATRPSQRLFARAQRAGGQDPDGWVLYRIERLAGPVSSSPA